MSTAALLNKFHAPSPEAATADRSGLGARRVVERSPAEQLARQEPANTSRLFAYLLMRFLHRAEYVRRRNFSNDVDLAIIAETIAVGALEPSLRNPGFMSRHSDIRSVVGVEEQRGINAFSIAAATGIPRETVRRKIKQLMTMEVVVEKGRGQYVIQPGFLQSSPLQSMMKEMESALMLFLSTCNSESLLKPAQAQPFDSNLALLADSA
jgi:hypothetical protein